MTKTLLTKIVLNCLKDQGIEQVFLFEPPKGKTGPCLRFLANYAMDPRDAVVIYPNKNVPNEVIERCLDTITRWLSTQGLKISVQLEVPIRMEIQNKI